MTKVWAAGGRGLVQAVNGRLGVTCKGAGTWVGVLLGGRVRASRRRAQARRGRPRV